MTRKLLLSNIAVVLLLVVGLAYVLIYLVRYNPLDPPYQVTVRLHETGGLYNNSDVTYLGDPVGDIKKIKLANGGVEVTVAIKSGIKIPRNTQVVVAGLSPVGEQYLDFEPRTDGGPYLREGDTIQAKDTTTPVAFATMMRHVYGLASQIKPEPIATIVTELATGLGDPDTDLRQIVDDSSLLLDSLTKTEPETLSLLRDSKVVLGTAADLRPQLTRFSESARQLTHDLATGAPTWRAAIEEVPPSLEQIMAVLQENTPALARLMDSSAQLFSVLDARGPAIAALLRDTPAMAAALSPFIHDGWGDGLLQASVVSADCAYGPTSIAPPWIVQRPKLFLNRHCTKHAPNLQQRGSYNAPRP